MICQVYNLVLYTATRHFSTQFQAITRSFWLRIGLARFEGRPLCTPSTHGTHAADMEIVLDVEADVPLSTPSEIRIAFGTVMNGKSE